MPSGLCYRILESLLHTNIFYDYYYKVIYVTICNTAIFYKYYYIILYVYAKILKYSQLIFLSFKKITKIFVYIKYILFIINDNIYTYLIILNDY